MEPPPTNASLVPLDISTSDKNPLRPKPSNYYCVGNLLAQKDSRYSALQLVNVVAKADIVHLRPGSKGAGAPIAEQVTSNQYKMVFVHHDIPFCLNTKVFAAATLAVDARGLGIKGVVANMVPKTINFTGGNCVEHTRLCAHLFVGMLSEKTGEPFALLNFTLVVLVGHTRLGYSADLGKLATETTDVTYDPFGSMAFPAAQKSFIKDDGPSATTRRKSGKKRSRAVSIIPGTLNLIVSGCSSVEELARVHRETEDVCDKFRLLNQVPSEQQQGLQIRSYKQQLANGVLRVQKLDGKTDNVDPLYLCANEDFLE